MDSWERPKGASAEPEGGTLFPTFHFLSLLELKKSCKNFRPSYLWYLSSSLYSRGKIMHSRTKGQGRQQPPCRGREDSHQTEAEKTPTNQRQRCHQSMAEKISSSQTQSPPKGRILKTERYLAFFSRGFLSRPQTRRFFVFMNKLAVT